MIFFLDTNLEVVLPQPRQHVIKITWMSPSPNVVYSSRVCQLHRNCCLELSTTLLTASFPTGLYSHLWLHSSTLRFTGDGNPFWWLQIRSAGLTKHGWQRCIHSSFTMDSYRSYWNSSMQSSTWVEGEDQDVYEVESRVPLPRPFPICSTLNEKNAVVVQTQISHVNHRTNGHLLKVISKISLPTPPYTVSSLGCTVF